jgi:hypothetical protein
MKIEKSQANIIQICNKPGEAWVSYVFPMYTIMVFNKQVILRN